MAIHDEKLYKQMTPYCIELFDNGTAITLLNRNYKPIGSLPNQQQQFFRNYRDYAYKLAKPIPLRLINELSVHRTWDDMEFAERRVYLYNDDDGTALTHPSEWREYRDKLAQIYNLPLAVTGKNNMGVFYG